MLSYTTNGQITFIIDEGLVLSKQSNWNSSLVAVFTPSVHFKGLCKPCDQSFTTKVPWNVTFPQRLPGVLRAVKAIQCKP